MPWDTVHCRLYQTSQPAKTNFREGTLHAGTNPPPLNEMQPNSTAAGVWLLGPRVCLLGWFWGLAAGASEPSQSEFPRRKRMGGGREETGRCDLQANN